MFEIGLGNFEDDGSKVDMGLELGLDLGQEKKGLESSDVGLLSHGKAHSTRLPREKWILKWVGLSSFKTGHCPCECDTRRPTTLA